MKRFIIGLTIVAAATASWAPAEAPALGAGKGRVTLTWDEFVKITGYDPARKGGQVVTIPWKEVEEMLGVKVKGIGAKGPTVDLPWGDFKALLEWSIRRKAPKDQAPPPTDYIVTACNYTGQLSDKGAEFVLKLKLDVLRAKGWKRIPVLPRQVAITRVTLPPDKKAYLHSTGKVYQLLTAASGPMELTVAFQVSVNRSSGVNRVNFPRILRGSSLLDLTVARPDADVKVAGAQSLTVQTAKGKPQTLAAAALPDGTAVSVTWQRAIEKAPAAPPKLYAETSTLVAVAESMLLCRQTVSYNILHSPIRKLALTVPPGANVVTVSGPQMQDWRVDKDRKLSVVLSREVIGAYALRVTYEQVVGPAAAVPVLRTVGAERERGFVGVVALANVEIAAGKVTGARQMDVRQLPGSIGAMTNQPMLLGFRYVGQKFNIGLSLRKHGEVSVLVTIADRVLYTVMQLNDGRRMTKAVFSVRNNRNQFLRMRMPAEAEIWSTAVGGRPVSPARDEQGNVLIPLIRSASRSRELASFPVEMVYVETPKAAAPPAGRLRVNLPTLHVPIMHVMCDYYLPAEGVYEVKGGWLAKGRSGFSGTLERVNEFVRLTVKDGSVPVPAAPGKKLAALQRKMDKQTAARARAAGATPIRVELPINGRRFKLQRILALPNDPLYFEVQYSGWKPAT